MKITGTTKMKTPAQRIRSLVPNLTLAVLRPRSQVPRLIQITGPKIKSPVPTLISPVPRLRSPVPRLISPGPSLRLAVPKFLPVKKD